MVNKKTLYIILITTLTIISGIGNSNTISAKSSVFKIANIIRFIDEQENLVIDGSDIKTVQAKVQKDKLTGINKYIVELKLNSKGTKKFAEGTANNIGKTIAIVYDGEIISKPVVNAAVTDGNAVIEGKMTYQEAENLAFNIRIGIIQQKVFTQFNKLINRIRYL